MDIIDGCADNNLTSNAIKFILENKKKFLVGRMPGIEANVLDRWVGKDPRMLSDSDLKDHIGSLNAGSLICGWKNSLEQNTGFYANKEDWYDVLAYWCDTYLDSLRQCDLLYRLNGPAAEGHDPLVKDFYDEIHVWSAVRLKQWMPFLEGKKVLAISAFEDSIKLQWKNRHKLFVTGPDPFKYPEFELSTIKAHNTIKGNEPFPCKNWKESFHAMCKEIDKKDFDIAVIGAGGYGMPLAHYVKTIGRGAIYVGSYIQIMFGIRGSRWNIKNNTIHNHFNEYWKNPEPHEIPKTFKNVEGGCYWL